MVEIKALEELKRIDEIYAKHNRTVERSMQRYIDCLEGKGSESGLNPVVLGGSLLHDISEFENVSRLRTEALKAVNEEVEDLLRDVQMPRYKATSFR